MVKFNYEIVDEQGIHARPAGELVKLVKNFQSKVIIDKGGKIADAGKILGLMGLGVKKGDEISVTVDGVDEEEAKEAIEEFLKKNL